MKLFLVLLFSCSVATTLAEPTLFSANQKCRKDATRLFKEVDVATLADCEQLCSDFGETCKHYTYGTYQGQPMCFGCNANMHALENHDGFNTYTMDSQATTEVTTEVTTIDNPFWLYATDQKCPLDDTRLFRIEDLPTLEACSQECFKRSGCVHFSYGMYGGKPICMGCNGHEDGSDHHVGFNMYEARPAPELTNAEWGTNMKCPFDKTRLFKKTEASTVEECYQACFDLPSCYHYSWGIYQGVQYCLGCSARRSELSVHSGFATYEAREAPLHPVCTASGWGDPHMVTFDGLKYDVHVPGELVFTRNPQNGAEVQGRVEKVKDGAYPAITTGLAIRSGDPSMPIIQISFATADGAPENIPTKQDRGNCPVELYVNGQAEDITAKPVVTGAPEAKIVTHDHKITVFLPDMQVDLIVGRTRMLGSSKCFFNFDLSLLDCDPSLPIVGLLGSPNDNTQDDWMQRDGTPLPLPSGGTSKFFFQDAFDYAKDNWLITNCTESLFQYEPGTSCYEQSQAGQDSEYDPEIERILEELEDPNLDGCHGDIGCLIDGVTIEETPEEFFDEPGATRVTDDELQTNSNEFNSDIVITAPSEPSAAPSCAGPTTGGSMGDPHFKTWKNEHYEYHGQCDMVLIKDEDFADGLGINVQIRTKLVRFWSYIQSVAIRIGDDILEVQGLGAPEPKQTNYWINLENQGELTTVGGFPVTLKLWSHLKRHFEIDLGSKYPGQKIVVDTFKEFVKVEVQQATEESFGNSVGLLGDFKTGETRARDGATVLHDFTILGNEWQVLPFEHNLFHDVAEPQFPKKCIEPEDPRGQRRRRLGESNVTEDQAEEACASLSDPADRKDCIYDILATQDLEMVGAY